MVLGFTPQDGGGGGSVSITEVDKDKSSDDSGGSFGVRDTAVRVADETKTVATGEINADLLGGKETSEVDPNARLSGTNVLASSLWGDTRTVETTAGEDPNFTTVGQTDAGDDVKVVDPDNPLGNTPFKKAAETVNAEEKAERAKSFIEENGTLLSVGFGVAGLAFTLKG